MEGLSSLVISYENHISYFIILAYILSILLRLSNNEQLPEVLPQNMAVGEIFNTVGLRLKYFTNHPRLAFF